MSRITFSGENVSISYVWEWYRVSEKAIREERKRVVDSLLTKDAIEDRFVGMNREDIERLSANSGLFLACETGWHTEGIGNPN